MHEKLQVGIDEEKNIPIQRKKRCEKIKLTVYGLMCIFLNAE